MSVAKYSRLCHATQRGIALVMVLWMIMVMMSLIATLLYAVKTETSLVVYARESAQARAFADAATHYAVMQLFLPSDQRELMVGGSVLTWHYQTYTAQIRAIGENGLLDLNTVARPLLLKLLDQLGVSDMDAERLADQIEDFRDVDDLKRVNGAEDEDYEQAERLAGAKDAPFERVEELQQVLDMTPALYKSLASYFSVYSRGQGINPMLAPRHVLLLLADNDAAAVDNYLKQRSDSAGAWVQPTFGQGWMDANEQPFYRLHLSVQADGSQQTYAEERAIRLLPGRTPPFMTYFRRARSQDATPFE